MSKLIYCSYSLMDAASQPDWLVKLADNQTLRGARWSLYDPGLGFTSNLESSPYLAAALSDNNRVSRAAAENQKALKLDPMLFRPLSYVLPRIRHADNSPALDVVFKNVYALLRSDIVLVDLNTPEHGEKSQEVHYAYLFGVPIVGIAHRFILSPWVVGKVNAVIFPKTTNDIVRQVIAYDPMTFLEKGIVKAKPDDPVESQDGENARASPV